VRTSGRMDYADIESQTNVFYEHMGREELEILLMESCFRACLLEVWGRLTTSAGRGSTRSIRAGRAALWRRTSPAGTGR